MKKNNTPNRFLFHLILAPFFFLFVVSNAKAQEVTAKEILTQAAKATLDNESISTAQGTRIRGSYTAVKLLKGQNEDLKNGFYAGILELDVSGDNYGTLRSGKFNLYIKNSRQGLKAYLEENGNISSTFAVTQTTPENYKDTRSSGKPELSFPQPITAMNSAQPYESSAISFASYTDPVKPHMWVKVCGKSCYWVQVY